MNWKPSFLTKRIRNVLTVLFGLGLLTALVFSLNTLFASGLQFSQEPSSTSGQSQSPKSLSPSLVPTSTPSKKTSTAQWKIYRNTTHDYSIKYPPHWTFSEDSTVAPKDRTIYFYDTTRKKSQRQTRLPYEGISIRVENNPGKLSLEEWATQLYKRISGGLNPNRALAMKRMFVSGNQALEISGMPSRFTGDFVLVRYNRKVLVAKLDAGLNPTEKQQSRYEDVFYKMLRTLQISKTSQ